MTKVGEKYVVEIGSEYGNSGSGGPSKLYRVKGFNSLVLDEDGLSRLEKYKPPAKETIVEDYGSLLRRVLEMNDDERYAAFRLRDVESVITFAAHNFDGFVREILKHDEPISAGDEVKTRDGNTFIVVSVEDGSASGYDVNNSFLRYDVSVSDVMKTGRRFSEEHLETIKKMRAMLTWRGYEDDQLF